MNKLRLDADALSVDSFPTVAMPAEGGTAAEYITQTANTCHLCTRYGCPDTPLC